MKRIAEIRNADTLPVGKSIERDHLGERIIAS